MEGFAFLATPNIKKSDIDFENVNYISKFRFDESPDLKLQIGDVLLAKDGSTLGVANCIRTLPRSATVNGSIAIIRPKTVHPLYLMYWLQSEQIQSKIQQLKDGMGVPHLFQADIRKLPIPVLPIEEQRRIADFLDDRVTRIDQIIAARISQKNAIRSLWRSTLDAELKGAGELRRLAWLLQLGAVGVVVNPSSYFRDEGVPFVHGYNVRDGYIDLSDVKRMSPEDSVQLGRSQLRQGDVLVVRAGYPGRAAVVPIDLEGGNCASVLVLRPGPELLPEWLASFFNSPLGRSEVERVQYGAAQGVLNLSDAQAMAIPLPSLNEQRRKLGRLDKRRQRLSAGAQALDRQIATLKQYKKSLIGAAVSSELDVSTAGSGIPR